MIGQTISHYEVTERLGAGGMGEVYLAQDTKLDRKVAVKILPPEIAANRDRMRRFTQEAKAAAALNHPNIAHIYEIGEVAGTHFIAMEYVEGKTLREKIHIERSELKVLLKHLLQVAEGLSKAHASGIVHRDLKPDNIMITNDGYAKILDFGLAKLIEPQTPASLSAASSEIVTAAAPQHSSSGVVMGTVGYMSPEQAQAKSVDQRSDIFSFGCILHEAATGRKPFAGDSVIDTLHKIIYEPAPAISDFNPSAPPDLQRVIRKCLAKEPDRRYQAIRDAGNDLEELLDELKSGAKSTDAGIHTVESTATDGMRASSAEYIVTGIKRHKAGVILILITLLVALAAGAYFYFVRAGGAGIDSIAVLPLSNSSNDPSTEYLSDGITESIINSLSQLQQLKVMARSTVFRFKGRDSDPQEVGKELGVRAVMTGRMLQQGENLIVSVELVNVADGTQLWGEQYNRRASDLAAVQQEIAQDVSERLRPQLSGEHRQLNKGGTSNTEAYRQYLLGRHYWNKRSAEGLKKAIEQFQQAIEHDPNYALAYVGLADCYLVLEQYTGAPATETLPRARAAVDRALRIDDSLAEAHTSSAMTYQQQWRWAEAEQEHKRAISLNPNYPTAHHWYQLYLRTMGRFDEALAEIKRAQELDPLSPILAVNVATVYMSKGDLDSAMQEAKRLLDLDPNFPLAHEPLGRVYLHLHKYPEAIAAFQQGVASDRTAYSLAYLGHAYAVAGRRAEALAILKELEDKYKRRESIGQYLAIVYLGLGELDQTFAWLEKDFQARSGFMDELMSPLFDPIRSDPRFVDLLRRVGLAQSEVD